MKLTNTRFLFMKVFRQSYLLGSPCLPNPLKKVQIREVNTFYLSRACQNIFNKGLAQFQSILFIRADLKAKALKVLRKT